MDKHQESFKKFYELDDNALFALGSFMDKLDIVTKLISVTSNTSDFCMIILYLLTGNMWWSMIFIVSEL